MADAPDPATVGHDLRNLAMQLLLRLDVLAAESDFPPSAREHLASLRRDLLQLQHLANDLQPPIQATLPPPTGRSPAADHPASAFSVLCVDDNQHLVEALERRLALEPRFGGFHHEDDLEAVVDTARRLQPSVILLDIGLPGGGDAMSLLDSLVRDVPDTSVIVFTGSPSNELVQQSISLGARGFIAKGSGSDRLISTILRVVDGESVFSPED